MDTTSESTDNKSTIEPNSLTGFHSGQKGAIYPASRKLCTSDDMNTESKGKSLLVDMPAINKDIYTYIYVSMYTNTDYKFRHDHAVPIYMYVHKHKT